MTQDKDRDKAAPSARTKGDDDRKARLAQALRANLRKRKAQARRQRDDDRPKQDG